jgi:hypothetical protein
MLLYTCVMDAVFGPYSPRRLHAKSAHNGYTKAPQCTPLVLKEALWDLATVVFVKKNEEGVSNNVSKLNDVRDECVSWRKA